MRVALALTITLAAGVAQAQGSVHAWCEEGRPGDYLDDTAETVRAAVQPLSAAVVILPCALIDSGRVGEVGDGGLASACADSPVYVMTHAGVVLCQVDVEWFANLDDDVVERGPSAAPSAPPAAHAALAALPVTSPPPPGPGALIGLFDDAREGAPRDAHSWRPPRPS